MKSKYGKINRQTISDQVYDIIVRKIADNEWKKGDKRSLTYPCFNDSQRI